MFCMCDLTYPFWPGLGALLLNVRMALCLNLGGAFLSAGSAISMSAISSSKQKRKTGKNKTF